MRQSIWSKQTQIPARGPLNGDLRADAAIVGGGMAGILTAYFLKKAGVRAVVLEAGGIGCGQTKNTTAKITSQHGMIYRRLTEQFGEEAARQYARVNQEAIEDYRRIIRELDIRCGFTECPAYLYTTGDAAALEQEYGAARRLGLPAVFTDRTELPFPVKAALRFEGQARFHPLEFLRAAAEPLEIYTDTRVQSARENTLETPYGTVTADHIVFACHYPFVNFPGYYFMRMHQERSYVVAFENAQRMEGMYLGVGEDELSFRPHEGWILLGGGGHRTGGNPAGGQYGKLRAAARRFWPDSREAAAWSAQDCITLDGVPYIGKFSAGTPGWYAATGFHKWGMTSSMAAARILCDLIAGRGGHGAEVFSPQRFKPSASAKSLMKDTAEAAKGLSRKFFEPPRETVDALPDGHGGVVEFDGEKAGVYKKDGQAFAVPIRCPHMGCQLEWNPEEKSWDCPCHGSRFDYRGALIDNPAQVGLLGD